MPQEIQRGAKAPNDIYDFGWLLIHSIPNGYRVIPSDDLAEITRRSQLMMEPPIGDEENLPARRFTVDNSRNVDACFTNDIAT